MVTKTFDSFSTTFHTFGCRSAETCLFCGRLDYTGIAVLITGSFLPWVYYSFYCEPDIKRNYMIAIGVLGSVCTAVSLLKAFALPKYRALRGLLFLGKRSHIITLIELCFQKVSWTVKNKTGEA